jgi:hypothetical protein
MSYCLFIFQHILELLLLKHLHMEVHNQYHLDAEYSTAFMVSPDLHSQLSSFEIH